MQPADNSLFFGMEALQSNNLPVAAMTGLRRNHSNLTLVSLSSESSDSTTSSQSTAEAPSRRRARNRRKKQKKEPENLVAKAVAEMNITEDQKAQYVALDCEMVGAGPKGKHSVLARVTVVDWNHACLLYTSPSPRDQRGSRMPSSA